jgi:hypothetical protein
MTEEVKSESEKKKEDWMNSKWRPMMGWSYMLTCIADFVIFPVLWSVLQAISKGQVNVQWQPITLQGAGSVPHCHGCCAGYCGLWSHTRKTRRSQQWRNHSTIKRGNNIYTPGSRPTVSRTRHISAPVANSFGSQPSSGFGSAPSAGFGSNAGFGAPAAEVTTGFGGKPAPVIPPFPEK